ncbi:MAG: acyl carrier protein [Candidatus Kapabacteria bacterium]|nr:acyl carrier protein [Candidatus Kapabacteria bacterium]
MEEQIKKIMSEVFLYPLEKITDSTSRNDVTNWDSLRHVQLILELEANFGLKFKPTEISDMNTFEKIKNYIINYNH